MKGTPSEKGCPSSGQNQNLSVVKNAPYPLPVSFADKDGERFSCLLTACIVPLRAGLSKSFLHLSLIHI